MGTVIDSLTKQVMPFANISLQVKNNESKLNELTDREENIGLNEVTVKATKPFIQQEVDKIILNVSGSFVANVGNAMDILKRAPSVRIDEQGGISLRNKSVIILIDGRRSNVTGESLET
eukprot:gene39840-63617_t